MRRFSSIQILLLAAAVHNTLGIQAPTGIVSRTGDQSVVLHWDKSSDSSLAGYRGLPGESAYCASKAAVNVYLDGLRTHLRGTGVSVVPPVVRNSSSAPGRLTRRGTG